MTMVMLLGLCLLGAYPIQSIPKKAKKAKKAGSASYMRVGGKGYHVT